jgi:hypothetical protein
MLISLIFDPLRSGLDSDEVAADDAAAEAVVAVFAPQGLNFSMIESLASVAEDRKLSSPPTS